MCVNYTVHTCHKSKRKHLYFLSFYASNALHPTYKHPHLSVILIFKEQSAFRWFRYRYFVTRCALYRAYLLRQQQFRNLFQTTINSPCLTHFQTTQHLVSFKEAAHSTAIRISVNPRLPLLHFCYNLMIIS